MSVEKPIKMEDILKLPLDQWELEKEVYERIIDCTECIQVGDLWKISAKELCLYCGLTKQQLTYLITKMKQLNYRKKHTEQCELNLRLYYDRIPD